jgi:hypothetical protein
VPERAYAMALLQLAINLYCPHPGHPLSRSCATSGSVRPTKI